MVPALHDRLGCRSGGANLFCISRDRSASVGNDARDILPCRPAVRSSGGVGGPLRVFAVALLAASLAACAQSAIVGEQSAPVSTRHAAVENPPAAHKRAAKTQNAKTQSAKTQDAKTQDAKIQHANAQGASYGLASFYGHESQTASGEKFNAGELTAAHRTLPFGTRVRVTDVATGRSVTVRVNDRGPFVPGRVVDVSQGAAESLGIVGRGVAKVKLDVVE